MSKFLNFRCAMLLAALLFPSLAAFAGEGGTLHGTVTDPLGAVVASAAVELIQGTSVIQQTSTDSSGAYSFAVNKTGRFQVRAAAPTFQPTTSNPVFVTTTE
ncbi:MAG: carboxypeptidase-like regulatory domain-containing protein, partial [Acidobacteriaceae bacterium]